MAAPHSRSTHSQQVRAKRLILQSLCAHWPPHCAPSHACMAAPRASSCCWARVAALCSPSQGSAPGRQPEISPRHTLAWAAKRCTAQLGAERSHPTHGSGGKSTRQHVSKERRWILPLKRVALPGSPVWRAWGPKALCMTCRPHVHHSGHTHQEERPAALPHGPPQHHLPAPAGRPLPGAQLQEGSAGHTCLLPGCSHTAFKGCRGHSDMGCCQLQQPVLQLNEAGLCPPAPLELTG